MSPKNILIAVLSLLALVVVLQNTQTVDTKFLFATISMPRALLLLITLLIGFVLGILLGARVRSPKKS